MAAISTYPTDLQDLDKWLVRGDPVAIQVEISDPEDPTPTPVGDRFWRAHVRSSEDRGLITEFVIEAIDDTTLLLRLSADESRKLKLGMMFDLEEITGDDPPVSIVTWWKVTRLGVHKDVSRV